MYKTIPCGICEYSIRDNELILRSFNDSAWKIYGFKDAKEFTENIGAPINLIQIPDNELDQIKTSINSLLTINKSISFDHRVIRNDGVVAWLHTDLQRIRSFDGEPIIQSVFEDITESHNDEINRYTASLLNLYDEVMEFDIVKDTATLKKSTYVSSNLINKPTSLKNKMSEYISKFVYEDDREKISRFLVESFSSNSNSNETKSVDYRLYNFKGGLSWCVLYLIKISDSVFLGCTKDTTMEKQAEEAIKQNEILAASNREKKTREELMHIVLSEHGFVITTYDVNTDILEYMTDSHGAETNGVVKEYLKNPTIPYIKSEHQKLVRDVFIEASKKESNGSFECLSKFDSATFRWKLIRYSSLLDESGKVYKVVSLISDIDEIKQNVSLVKSLSKSLGIKFESKTYNSVTDQLFQLLYDIKDTKVAINTVLAIVGKTLGASRSYLFEEDMDGIHCTNTFEWTNKGIPPVIQNNISFTHPISSNDYYTRFFNNDGMYVLNDIETLEPRFVENYRKQNVKALIQCVLKQDNKYIGYVGFDDDVRKRNWTNDQIHMVFLLSKTIGILLERKRQEDKSEVAIADFKALMNNSSALVYLINPDTYEILFENESVLKQKGNCVGKKCYKAFMDNDSPCYDCPYKALVKNGTSIPVEIVDISGKKFIMQASRTCFRDMDAINITGTDISVFDSKSSIDFEKARQADLNKYMNTLFTIYDEIFEINSETRTAEVVRSRFNDKACGKTQPCGEAFDKWFKLMATPRDLEITKKFFNCNMIMEGYKSSSVPPQTEYDIRLPNGEIHNISTIIYKVDNVNFLLCTKDITKLKQAEALRINNDLLLLQREDQEKYRIIVEQLGATVIEYNFITNKFYASEGYKKYATSQQDQSKMLNNQGDMSVIYPDDIPLLEKFFKESSSRKGHSEVILRLKMVDGTFRWTKMESTYVRDKSNKPVRVIGTFTDVNDEMASLYNYQETSLRLENIVSNIPCVNC